MKRKLIIILSVIVVLLTATYIFLSSQERHITNLENQVSYLQEEFCPLAFEIQNNNNADTIKAKFAFYDLNNEKTAIKNISIKGTELHIDFKVISFSEDNFLFFPYKVYSDKVSPLDATIIYDAYDRDGFPEIYDGILELKDKENNEIDKKSKEKITEDLVSKFSLVKNSSSFANNKDHAVALHDIKEVSKFQKGFVYKVICHPHTGALEIKRK